MVDSEEAPLTGFEYRYRDAGNFKASGRLLLTGSLSESERDEIIARLEDSELFIAEQIGIPTLYGQLYAINGGPNDDDHCWHEFVRFCDIGAGARDAPASGSGRRFIECVSKRRGVEFESVSSFFDRMGLAKRLFESPDLRPLTQAREPSPRRHLHGER